MMRKPRLFFSHSTENGSLDHTILTRLEQILKTDYEILLDRTALVAGSGWRSAINVWIRICDVAVILVTPKSIESDYCRYEWAILSFRQKEDNLLIIPIYHGATPDAIKGRADQIYEISSYLEFDNIESLTREVQERLVADLVLKDRAQLQISYVAKVLEDAVKRVDVIETAADKIDLDLGTWDFSADKWHKFAVKIMGAGIGNALPVLLDLQGFFGRTHEEQFSEVVDLIGFCSWVDMGSIHRIKGCSVRAAAAQAPFGLNADEVRTATCYVLSASERSPRTGWPIGTAHGVFASYDDLHQGVQAALLEALNLNADTNVDKLARRLDTLRQRKQPVFVVLKAGGLSANWLKRLHETELFAWVNFLVLTGKTGIMPGLLPDEAWLKPLLPDGFERAIWDEYEEAREILGIAQV
jgi:hypothetical protein